MKPATTPGTLTTTQNCSAREAGCQQNTSSDHYKSSFTRTGIPSRGFAAPRRIWYASSPFFTVSTIYKCRLMIAHIYILFSSPPVRIARMVRSIILQLFERVERRPKRETPQKHCQNTV